MSNPVIGRTPHRRNPGEEWEVGCLLLTPILPCVPYFVFTDYGRQRCFCPQLIDAPQCPCRPPQSLYTIYLFVSWMIIIIVYKTIYDSCVTYGGCFMTSQKILSVNVYL